MPGKKIGRENKDEQKTPQQSSPSEAPKGGEVSFTEAVYQVVRKIPRGKTMTYAQVARAIGKPGAVRAVGNALNKNHDPKIPCHRVIRSDGKIGGYNAGISKKRAFLLKEGAIRDRMIG